VSGELAHRARDGAVGVPSPHVRSSHCPVRVGQKDQIFHSLSVLFYRATPAANATPAQRNSSNNASTTQQRRLLRASAMTAVLWLALLLAPPSTIPLPHRAELTVFHVNPASYPDAPVDMNTGDGAGDLFFNLQTAFTPILCRNRTSVIASGLACKNAETTAPDLVVTKLRLVVDRRFGLYQLCNICVDGHDPIAMPPPPPPPGTPPTLQCRTGLYPAAAAATNCSAGDYCYKLKTSNTTMLQGCDTGGLCAKFIEPPGQCFGLPNPATGSPIDIICSERGEDSLPDLDPADFRACPLISPASIKPPLGRNCSTGEYLCDCPGGKCAANEVGAQNIRTSFGPGSSGARITAGQVRPIVLSKPDSVIMSFLMILPLTN
jgi:hypothetical protein